MHPNFLQCERPFWRGDDFTTCIRRDLIQVLLPSLVVGLSMLWLTASLVHRFISGGRSKGYRKLPTHQNALGVAAVDDGDSTDDDDDEFAEHLSLRHTMSHGTFTEAKVLAPTGEVVLAVCEVLGASAILGIFIAEIFKRNGDIWNYAGMPFVSGVVCWGYVALLTAFRLWFSVSGGRDLPSLWDHTALIYMFNFIFATVAFRTALIQPEIGVHEAFIITQFVLITLLCIIALSSRRGNKPVELKVIDGLEPSKEPLASLFSLASFSWVDGIVWKGYWKPYELEELWNLREDDIAYSVLSTFRQTKKASSLAITLLKHFKRDLAIQSAWAVFASAFTFAPTLLLRVILQYVQSPEDTPKNVAWLFVVLLFVAASISAIGNGQALFIGRRICIRLRAVIIGEVYAKALRRKAAAGADKELGKKDEKKKKKKDGKKLTDTDDKDEKDKHDGDQANVGAIINLMAVDSFKVAEVCAYLHYLIAAVPVQVVIAIALLYQILGWSSIAGIGVMILLLPINYYISSQFSKIQQAIMSTTDKRIHTTNEVLQNIRIIKFFAWEERFGQVVDESRTAELKNLRRRYILWAVAATSWYGSPIIITFLSFFCYTVIEGKDLNAPVAFTALSLFNVLRVPLDQLADMVTNVLQTKVSIDRVEDFLSEEDTEKYIQLKSTEDEDPDAPLIGFKDATFTWGSKNQVKDRGGISAFQLQDLNITFIPEELNIIAGPTGSGKTSLLMALLGEMTRIKGIVRLPGAHSREDLTPDPETGLTDSVAYCAQQAWLVNDTIKNNILFASPYDEERYHAVLIACSLERDFQILDNGDETEVGEKGITLSGGQKQRISLARALYSKSKHLLLDDCLSAVDSHTAKWIYDYCIMGPLMHARTCILVTHNVALCVPLAKHVVVMENGRVLAQGDPESVVASGALGNDELLKSGVKSRPASRMPSRVPSFIGTPTDGGDQISKPKPLNGSTDLAGKKDKKSGEETKLEGSVDWKVYKLYLTEMGPWWYWAIVLSIFGAQQMGTVATSVWIRQWSLEYETEANEGGNFTTSGVTHSALSSSFGYFGSCFASGSCSWAFPTTTSPNTVGITSSQGKVNVWYYLIGYLLIGLVYTTMSFIREAVVFYGSLRASKRIHERLLHHIMRAKFRFFDSTPLGRIINRFSKDVEAIDQEVAPVALGMVHSLASVIAIVILISVITPGFLGAGVIISMLYWLIGAFYLRASRDLKRIESIQRSPLYQHFGETLTGVATIRAYGDERRFVRENLNKIDAHNRPFFFLWACNRWLGFRVDIAGALVSFFAGVFVVSSVGKIDAGLAGLSLTYAITFTDNVLWVVRLYAMNEQNMNSVERIREYLEVEQEAAEIIPENRPYTNWPESGSVTFSDYSTRYRPDLDPVLKHVSFEIKPFEKVGIVGRTGAGKSSLALALFRSLEAETGKIIIDGIDISKIGLRDLRQSITMVPQDPTLFTGTIRSNLDPFGVYTDGEIFRALKRVQLINEEPEVAAPVAGDDASINKNIFLDLQSAVAESGNNLSQGQKQLLCLARALLKEPKVLLMDEATASIDYTTDTKIQATIRELKSTTITIAHRLNSIIYYDKVLVLDQGEVREYDHPHNLLKNPDSIFREITLVETAEE
ncbi:uncharacterized protein H6S33_012469 [Morchella sextelata]|uniref:uncharacterized protein n=1 Tax=Morchella sextelata TaxID=1174677 RepID=UPI001D0550AE|nr:uncharacterized protein H6S33_012469 [Morchella sextelata]KAH0609923.1 hypothetical protein H6S33_012469 [Morchella sextelata]